MASRERRKPKNLEAVPPPLATAPPPASTTPMASECPEQPNDQARARGAIDERGLKCPECGCRLSTVKETRKSPHGIRRIRQCEHCGDTYGTYEKLASEAQ